jgi:hypothetical protein
MPHGLDADVWEALLEGLVLRKYNLLLGAGASRDVLDRRGNALPSGLGMADELAADFALSATADEKKDLKRIYQAVAKRTSVKGRSRDEWVSDRFTRTQPPEWYDLIGAIGWQAAWTLNIDDAVERALEKKCRAINFTESTSDVRDGVLPVVHLHGLASRPEEGLIFSVKDYRDYVRNPRSWALKFQETLSDEPFVILGAALHHEFDLSDALAARALALGRKEPSIAVLPNPSDLDRADLASWNIQVFDGTARAFLEAVRDELPRVTAKMTPTLLEDKTASPLLVQFLEQWHPVAREKRTKWHDLFAGEEPEYADALSGDIIERSVENLIWKNIEECKPTLLFGRPFSGKSSLLMHLAARLAKANYKAYEFRGDARLQWQAVLARVRAEPTTVLLVEQANEYAAAIVDLVEHAQEQGTALRLVVIDRDGPSARLRQTGLFEDVEVRDGLDDDELARLITLLERRGSLPGWAGRKAGPTIKELRAQRLTSMSAIVSKLVLGEGFEERVRRDYRSLPDEGVTHLALLAAICSRIGRGITVGLAAAALDMTPRMIEGVLDTDAMAGSMLVLDNNRVRLRHRFYADLLTARVAVDRELYDVAVALCDALAPQVTIESINQQSWVYRMAGHILDQERLAGFIGRSKLDDFYTDIADGYSWNSRFWEQRALAAYRDPKGSTVAQNYAGRAVGIRRDSYTLNTFATIRLRNLRKEMSKANPAWVTQEFWECTELLEEARGAARLDSEHPFVTWFSGAGHYRRWQQSLNQGEDPSLNRSWREWWDKANASNAFRGEEGNARLRDFQRAWLVEGVAGGQVEIA